MLRNNNIYSEIINGNTPSNMVDISNCKGIIMCGDYAGSLSGIEMDKNWFLTELPVLALGSCALALNAMFGGRAMENLINDETEDIFYNEEVESTLKTQSHALINGRGLLPGDRMLRFACIRNDICIDIKHTEKEIYGIQRKFERNDPNSIEFIQNFVTDACNCKQEWDVFNYVQNLVETLPAKYAGKKLYAAVSGGLDSAVATCIMKQAFGDSIECILIDTGFFRENECNKIISFYRDVLKLNIEVVNAKDVFQSAIENEYENKQKIIIIDKLLCEVIRDKINEYEGNSLLITGTNYNDFLPNNLFDSEDSDEQANFDFCHPLKPLFKFEIKQLAEAFLLPDYIVYKKPFQSAGLATSIVGQVNEEKLNIVRRIEEIYTSEIEAHNLEKKLKDYGVRLVPAVPLKNKYQLYLRATQDSQNIVSYAYRMPYDLLESVSEKIIKEFNGIIRHILFDVTPMENTKLLE